MLQFATENHRGSYPKIGKVFVGDVDVTDVCTAFDRELGLANVIEWEGYPAPPAKERKLVRRGGRPVRRILRGAIRTMWDWELKPIPTIYIHR